jgi:menaquinone-9 beta-reductase
MVSATSGSPEPAGLDVLVVGAGPAGSATAALLAQTGYAVAVVDRATFPRDKACSEYMGPETVRVLARLGVLDELEATGATPLEGTEVTGARGARLRGVFALAGHRPFRQTGLSVSRRILDDALARAAVRAGALLLERTTVEELVYDRGAVGGAVVRDSDGSRRTIRARLTVGADGLRSMVARRIGRARYGVPRRIGFVAHFDDVDGMARSAELFVGREGYVGLNPIGGGRTNVALVVPSSRAAHARGRAEEFYLESLRSFPQVQERLEHASLARRVLVTGPFASSARRVIADGAALVGDAADFFDPFTGEGIFSALRGAEMLSDVAADALASAGPVARSALAPYRRARRRAFAGKWAVERLIGYGMWWPALFDRAVARLGRRGAMAHTLIGVTGDFVPARAVLNPFFIARMVL